MTIRIILAITIIILWCIIPLVMKTTLLSVMMITAIGVAYDGLKRKSSKKEVINKKILKLAIQHADAEQKYKVANAIIKHAEHPSLKKKLWRIAIPLIEQQNTKKILQ